VTPTAYNMKKHTRLTSGAANRHLLQLACEICSSVENLELHRITPGGDHGLYVEENVSTLCKTHHLEIHKRMGIFKLDKSYLEMFEKHKGDMILELVTGNG
jgi:hypothetical protein